MHEHVDAMVADAVLHGRKQAELSLEAENIPRIHDGAAMNGPLQQIVDFGQQPCGPGNVAALERQMSDRDLAADRRQQAGGSHGHDFRLPLRRGQVAHRGKQPCQANVLQLHAAQARQSGIEVMPGAGKGLPQRQGFGPQAFASRPLDFGQAAAIKLVAIRGDARQQRRQRRARIMAFGPAAADAGGHEHRSGQHDSRFLPAKLRFAGHFLDALQQGVERHGLQYEASVIARVVNRVRVPLAEMIVRSLVGRMIEIISTRIERQLLQMIRIEVGLIEQGPIRAAQHLERRSDQVVITPAGDPRAGNEKRKGANPFVTIRFDLLGRPQHGDRSMADKVVQRVDCTFDDTGRLRPGPFLRERGLAGLGDEVRLKKRFLALMRQQIAVELSIPWQNGIEDQRNQSGRLLDRFEASDLPGDA